MDSVINNNFTGIVIIIYSCFKLRQKSNLLYNLIKELKSNEIKIYILNGNEKLSKEYDFNDKYLFLKCDDNYEGLYLKTKKLMKEIINIFPKMKGLIKIDDDIFPNINFLKEMIRFVSNKFVNYSGKVFLNKKINTVYTHIEKCQNPKYKFPLTTPVCIFCPGPCYYLSNKAIKFFNKNCKDFFSEDIMVGYTFTNTNIKAITYPTYYDNKLYQWACNVQNLKDNLNHGNFIFIKLHGGLGNQLFQVAAGVHFCLKYNFLPILVYEDGDRKKDFYPHSNQDTILTNIFCNFNKITLKKLKELDYKCILFKPENSFTDAYNFYGQITTKSHIYFDGYFQNINYFQENSDLISELFINDIQISRIKNIFKNLEKSYFIHIRRGDYVGKKQYEINYDFYFKESLNLLLKKEKEKIKMFVLSNDIEYCKTYQVLEDFKEKINFTFITKLNEIESFYLMTLCKGGIISNSSYSWWGSYLNKTPNKIIIIPKIWLPNTNICMKYDNVILV